MPRRAPISSLTATLGGRAAGQPARRDRPHRDGAGARQLADASRRPAERCRTRSTRGSMRVAASRSTGDAARRSCASALQARARYRPRPVAPRARARRAARSRRRCATGLPRRATSRGVWRERGWRCPPRSRDRSPRLAARPIGGLDDSSARRSPTSCRYLTRDGGFVRAGLSRRARRAARASRRQPRRDRRRCKPATPSETGVEALQDPAQQHPRLFHRGDAGSTPRRC